MVIWRDFPFVVHFFGLVIWWSLRSDKKLRIHELTWISIWRNQVLLGEGLEQRLSWKISENSSCTDFGIGWRMLSFTCDSDHVSFFTSPTTKKSNLQKKSGRLSFPDKKTWTTVTLLLQPYHGLPVLCQSGSRFCMLLGGSNDPYGETLHSLLSLVRGKYLNIAPWEQEDTFFLDGRGWCCYHWILVNSRGFCVRTQWEKREMNGIGDGDVVSGY